MEFVQPWFLFGLFALAIPVLIHLFNLRRFKRVYFTNVRFLKEVKVQTRKQSKWQHLLVLLARILVFICLVLAFAQPYIPMNNQGYVKGEKHKVSIYIDNSFSMEARNARGTLLDDAKSRAKEIPFAYQPSDEFQLLTNDFEGKHQQFVSRDEFINMVDDVKISPVVQPVSKIIARQKDMLAVNPAGNHEVYLISDFQHTTTDFSSLKKDTATRVFFVPVAATDRNNLYIDSCWFSSPVHLKDEGERLTVRIKNSSEQSMEKIPVKLTINGKQKAVASCDVKSEASAEVTLSYTNRETGIQYGKIEINDYPVYFDDSFYFSYQINDFISVLCINGGEESRYLNALFGGDSSVIFRNNAATAVDYSALPGYRLVVLNQLKSFSSGLMQSLDRFLEQGGNVTLIPPAEPEFDSYAIFLTGLGAEKYLATDTADQKVTILNYQHPLFRNVFEKIPENVDMPTVYSHFILGSSVRSEREDIMKMQNGSPLCCSFSCRSGKLYVFTCPLEIRFTSFPTHPLFVPTIYNMALLSQKELPLYYTIGNNTAIALPNVPLHNEQVIKIKALQNDFEIIPESHQSANSLLLYTHGQIIQSGHYNIETGDAGNYGVAFNFDRKESEMQCMTSAEIKDALNRLGDKNYYLLQANNTPILQAINDMRKGTTLWKTFVVLALVFLAAEVALLRFWK